MKRFIVIMIVAAFSAFADYEWIMPVPYPSISIGGGQWLSVAGEIYMLDRLLGISVGAGYTEGFNRRANSGYDRAIVMTTTTLLYLGDKNGIRLGVGVKGIFPVWSFSGYISGQMSEGMMPPLVTARFEFPIGQLQPFIDVMYIPGRDSKYYWTDMPGMFNERTEYESSDATPWALGLSFGVKWHWPK